MRGLSEKVILAGAKAISPYAWNDCHFIDDGGKHWKNQQARCQSQAMQDAIRCLNAAIPLYEGKR